MQVTGDVAGELAALVDELRSALEAHRLALAAAEEHVALLVAERDAAREAAEVAQAQAVERDAAIAALADARVDYHNDDGAHAVDLMEAIDDCLDAVGVEIVHRFRFRGAP